MIPPHSGDSLAVFHVFHSPSVPWLLLLGARPAQSARPYLRASLCTWNSGPEHVPLRTRFHKPAGGCRWRPWTAGPSWRTDPRLANVPFLQPSIALGKLWHPLQYWVGTSWPVTKVTTLRILSAMSLRSGCPTPSPALSLNYKSLRGPSLQSSAKF